MYAGGVSHASVHIAFMYAALNGLDIFTADIRNACLQAVSSQKYFIICGPEFGLENAGRVVLIHRTLYGGKSVGKDFQNNLKSGKQHLSFTSCPDPDVWMHPAERPPRLSSVKRQSPYSEENWQVFWAKRSIN